MLAGKDIVKAGYGANGKGIVRAGCGFKMNFLTLTHPLTNFKTQKYY